MRPLPVPPVLVITDRTQAARPLPDIAAALFAGGIRWLSLRDKDLPAGERLALARALVALGKPFDATVTVHGDIDLALAAGAAGVHLGRDGDPAAARDRLGPAALIGVSAHDRVSAAEAARRGADYVTLSPIFLTASKPGYGPALGVDGLAKVVETVSIPVIALGGLNPHNIIEIARQNTYGAAVMGLAMHSPSSTKKIIKTYI